MSQLIVTYNRTEYLEMLRNYLLLCIGTKTKNPLREIESKMYLASKLDEFKFETACEFAKNRNGSILNWFPAIYSSLAILGDSKEFKIWMCSEFEKFKMDVDGFTRVGAMAGSIPQNLLDVIKEYNEYYN